MNNIYPCKKTIEIDKECINLNIIRIEKKVTMSRSI